MPSRRALALSLVSAAALIAPASAMASLAQPAVVDAAGDAQNRFGTNQASVDILSGDITTDGTDLRFRITFAGTPAISSVTGYSFTASAPVGSSPLYSVYGLNLVASVSSSGTILTDDAGSDPTLSQTSGLGVWGTSSVSGNTLTATFPLVALNQQLALQSAPAIGAGTALSAPRAFSANVSRNLLGQPSLRAASDQSPSGAPTFILGGD